jgi:hypothetical protein
MKRKKVVGDDVEEMAITRLEMVGDRSEQRIRFRLLSENFDFVWQYKEGNSSGTW